MRTSAIGLVWLFALVSGLPACAGPLKYSAEPIEAWVMDAETKQPLRNVVVVANWALETTSRIVPHQTNQAGSLVIMEAITDENGRFHFPAWGPKWHLGSGALTDSDPELILFKSGYHYRRVSNSQYLRPSKYSDVGKPSGTESKPTGSRRISFWSGERIELAPFTGTLEKYAEHLSFLHTSLRSLLENCNWKKIPRMLLVLKDQKDIFKKQDVRCSLYAADYVPTNEKECGSPEEFFRSYRP